MGDRYYRFRYQFDLVPGTTMAGLSQAAFGFLSARKALADKIRDGFVGTLSPWEQERLIAEQRQITYRQNHSQMTSLEIVEDIYSWHLYEEEGSWHLDSRGERYPDERFLDFIAHFVVDGSHLDFAPEDLSDEDPFRFLFRNGTWKRVNGSIVFPE